MDVALDTINQVVLSIINVSDSLSWWSGERKGENFQVSIVANNKVQHIVAKAETTMRGKYEQFCNISIVTFIYIYGRPPPCNPAICQAQPLHVKLNLYIV